MIVHDGVSGRTIDTGSGVYLVPGRGSADDDVWGFTVVDGETRIAGSATRIASRIGQGRYLVEYDVEAAPVLVGRPLRSGYAGLIERLIAAHCEACEGRRGGREVEAQVAFAPRFVDKLGDWEAAHGLARHEVFA